jgi:GNAT superfamily N-acetyltransferase
MTLFQTASIHDAPHIADLVNSAYRGEGSKRGWTTEADILDGQRTDTESLVNIIETPLNQIDFSINPLTQQLLGCVHLIQELPDTLYFGMLTVAPHMQGQGFGKIMMTHIEDVARKHHLRRVRFTVIPIRGELIAFYERRGYHSTGRFEPFPVTDPKFGLPKIEGLILKEYEKILDLPSKPC